MSFPIPIVLLVFNRPDATRRMFESIRAIRPTKLMIVADGPRPNRPGEEERCEEVRRIVSGIDWPCHAQGNFSPINLGLKTRIVSGLNWVFEQNDQAIIIEDDCVADPSFFPFAQELLTKYADDERVMSISGNNFLFGRVPIPHSYYFSRVMHCWGWATWRRAWALNDATMPFWPELCNDGWLESLIHDPVECRHWRSMFEQAHSGRLNSWATAWTYNIWRHNGLCIQPSVNLVSNICFAVDEATNTNRPPPYLSFLNDTPRTPMPFPLVHPPHMVRNFAADDLYHRISVFPHRRYSW